MVLRGKVLFAYVVVCILWGSTYIAIRIGDRTLPPLLFAGVRFFIAGVILFIGARTMTKWDRPLPFAGHCHVPRFIISLRPGRRIVQCP